MDKLRHLVFNISKNNITKVCILKDDEKIITSAHIHLDAQYTTMRPSHNTHENQLK